MRHLPGDAIRPVNVRNERDRFVLQALAERVLELFSEILRLLENREDQVVTRLVDRKLFRQRHSEYQNRPRLRGEVKIEK